MANIDEEGLREAIERRLGRSLDDTEWLEALREYKAQGNREPYGDGDIAELAEQLRDSNAAMLRFAERMRKRLVGHSSPDLFRTLVKEASAVAVELAVWLKSGKPPRHFVMRVKVNHLCKRSCVGGHCWNGSSAPPSPPS